jgi:hypothetical protein
MTHRTVTSKRGSRLLPMVSAMLTLAFLLSAGEASAVMIRSQVETFGSDGTAASSFASPSDLTFRQATRGLYAVDGGAPGIYGFDVSALPAHPPLSDFSPLGTVSTGGDPGLAVDDTALSSAGNVYFASESTGLIYGFNSSGAPLGGNFPIDPAISPGAPSGSPKDICGAVVDSAGNLWVSNFGTESILEYSAAGSYKGTVSSAPQHFRPCSVAFDSNDDMYLTDGNGSSGPTYKYTAASSYTAATLITSESGRGNAFDRSTHHVFTINNANTVKEYDSDGNLVSITSARDTTGHLMTPSPGSGGIVDGRGVTVDPVGDRIYVSDASIHKIRVFGEALTYPDLNLGTASEVANTTTTLNGTISAQGAALTDCHFEYVSEAAFGISGFDDLSSGGSVPCTPSFGAIPVDSNTHSVSGTLSGLTTNSAYRARLVAANENGDIATLSGGFETTGPPTVETTGSPVRTATTARLDSRVDPRHSAATYHFEYGAQGPCDLNPCTATEPRPAGSGGEVELVSQQLEGLEPGTTYHYRVVADNGNPDGPAFGEDMTLTTFASNAALSHGQLPGPPGSDRAWEQVNAPDTGGNPVTSAVSISDDGERAVYRVSGGTPLSESGTFVTELFAERTPGGWQTKKVYPSREEANEPFWYPPGGPGDLSTLVVPNMPATSSGRFSTWRLTPNGPSPTKLFETDFPLWNNFIATSDDGTRVLVGLKGPQDPAHPVAPGALNLFDIGSGSPQLIDLLPDGSPPACGIANVLPGGGGGQLSRGPHWVSPDGSLAFFPSKGNANCESGAPSRLYLRDIPAETTTLLDPPSGGLECDAYFIRSTPGTAFFYTDSRLVAKDTEATACSQSSASGDVYRYDLNDGGLECVTCVVPGVDAAVDAASLPGAILSSIGVSADGSRVYFRSAHHLLPGTPDNGTYRLDVDSGDLAYVGRLNQSSIGESNVSAMTPDGSVVIFRSGGPSLNALGGQQNGGTDQYYRYDDRDRSLICISCPANGSLPRGAVPSNLGDSGLGANTVPIDEDGGIAAFSTPTPLGFADQNTAAPGQSPVVGLDAYEWRDGRLLLISDGLTNWPVTESGVGSQGPEVHGVSPSGRDVFFTAAAQYTQDALDGYKRLYDARIGGGFQFPAPPRPCPLEVCQGTPKGAPEEAAPGTGSYNGAGNAPGPIRCAKGKRKVRKAGTTRCVKPRKPNRKAHHKRRTTR